MTAETERLGTIRVAAALVIGDGGHVLLVRKRGTQAFMQPGGKIEPNEEPLAALVRELREELGLAVAPSVPVYLKRCVAPAANEPGFAVDAEVFRLSVTGAVAPAAEIEEIAWVDPAALPELPLAPLTRDHILPLCLAADHTR
jgi:8-oxo-dGTP pyrophosphatase MutT (NUDIX family)